MPDTWTKAFNWLTPDIPGDKISPYCPDILLAHQHDPNAKSDRNSTNVPGVSRQILKAITMLPYQLRSAGIINPIIPESSLQLQMEMKSESSSGTHIVSLSVHTKHGVREAALYHTCKALSDSHPCYHMIMALMVYNLFANQSNEFYQLFRDNVTKPWNPVDLIRAGDEFYYDINGITVPREVRIVPETVKRDYSIDLMPFIIHGSPISTNNAASREISIDTTSLLETMDRAANIALELV